MNYRKRNELREKWRVERYNKNVNKNTRKNIKNNINKNIKGENNE